MSRIARNTLLATIGVVLLSIAALPASALAVVSPNQTAPETRPAIDITSVSATLEGWLGSEQPEPKVPNMAAPSALADVGVSSWRATGSLLRGHRDEQVVALASGRVLVVYADDEEVTPAHPTFTERLATELYEPDSGTWIPGPVPPARNASTIVPLSDGGALLLGECASESQGLTCLPTAATYRLNASDSVWTASAQTHEARARPAVVRLADGRLLVAGGFGGSCTPRIAFGYSCAPLSSAEIFDPATGVWSPTAPMPAPRGGASATLLSDGMVLLVGGDSQTGDVLGSSQTDDVLRFNPVSERWTTLRPSPSPLTGSKLLSLPGDRAIALGYEPRAGFYGSLGGAGKQPRLICESVPLIYTAAHGTWTAAPPLPEEPISCSTNAVPLTNGQILYESTDQILDKRDPYVLDRHQQCWATTGAPVARHEGILTALLGDRALDLGGTTNDEASFTGAEIYTPRSQTCSVAQRSKTSIFTRLAPQGKAAKIATVLAAGYSFSLKTIKPGRLAIDWYYTRKEIEGQPGPVLVGAGRANSTRRGTVKLTLRLTAAGRELVERPGLQQLQLTARGSFTARGGKRVTTTRPFTFNR